MADQKVYQRPPWYFSLFFMVGGLAALFYAGQITALQCRHIEPFRLDCVKETNWMGLIQMGEKETIRDVRGAQVDESCDDGCTYRVQLTRRQGGVVPLTTYSYSPNAEQVAARINAYAEHGGGETLELRMGLGLWGLIMGVILTLAGFGLIIVTIKSKRRVLLCRSSGSGPEEAKRGRAPAGLQRLGSRQP